MHKKSTRKDRIEIFLDTQNWIKQDADLSASVDRAKKNTEIFYEDEYPVFDRKLTHTVVKVSKDRSYQAAMRLSKRYNGKKIAVLNFANAFHAGGGVTSGASAQEECLCRTSTLYPLIYRRTLRDTFYKHHKDLNTPKASDSLIYTEGVVICKTDCDYPERMPKEDWPTVDVITMAAPDLRVTSNIHAPIISKGTFMNDAELFGYHVKRALHMLTVAAAKKADILVLGAFGCGAFQNNPDVVANAYKTALSVFPKVFEHIEFAVYCPPNDSSNYEAFYKYLDCRYNIHEKLTAFINEPDPDKWLGFSELMHESGFEMDCYNSAPEYEQYDNPEHTEKEIQDNLLKHMENWTLQQVGNYIFSRYRELTHWSDGGYPKEKGTYFFRKAFEILEDKIKE